MTRRKRHRRKKEKNRRNHAETKQEQEENTRPDRFNRISELPEPIIHQILSHRPMENAIQTSFLSKLWRPLWSSIPVLDFDSRKLSAYFPTSSFEFSFLKFVDRSLLRREKSVNIQKFRLHMAFYRACLKSTHIDYWINSIVDSNVEEFDLFVERDCTVTESLMYYSLPQIIFSAKSMTVMKLENCRLEPSEYINLPSLQKLSLIKVKLDDYIFQNLIFGCPSVEDLRIEGCDKLSNIWLQCRKLKSMELNSYCQLEVVIIESWDLESFAYKGQSIPDNRQLKNSSATVICPALKTLSFEGINVTEESLEDCIPNLPFLEKLILVGCSLLKDVKICSQQLKSFVLESCNSLLDVEINTPNLISLRYSGYLISLSLINTSPLLEAKISLDNFGAGVVYANWSLELIRAIWFIELRNFLEMFNRSKVLTLCRFFDQTLIVPVEWRDVLLRPIYDLKHLKLELYSRTVRDSKLFQGLLWLFPSLETLSIDEGHTKRCSKSRTSLELMDMLDVFEGNDEEMQMVQFLLGEAAFLKTLISINEETCPETD